MPALVAAIASTLLSLAVAHRGGQFGTLSLVLAVSAFLICLVGVCRRTTPDAEARAVRLLPWVLGALVLESFIILLTRTPGVYLTAGTSLAPFHIGVVVAGLITMSYLLPVRALDHVRLPALVILYLVLGAWLIHASPAPQIDVWHFHQRAAELLLHGQNPWAADYPNVYGNTDFVAPALLVDGRVVSYPYPPLSLLLTVPGVLLGDSRWSLLFATGFVANLVIGAARRAGVAPGDPREIGAVMLLFHARSFFMLEQAWTDVFIALGAAGCAWAMTAAHRGAMSAAIAGLLSAKQYGLLWLPALWRPGRVNARTLAIGVLLAGAFALPFFLWDPAAFWRGIVVYQWAQPFRPDSLSLAAWWAGRFGAPPWQGLAFIAAALTAFACARFAPRDDAPSPARGALAGAATYLALFLFAKQAFLNYYWFVGVLLAIAIVVPARRV